MPEDRLREKAVLTAVKVFQKTDDYFQRAQLIKNKFDADEDGVWGCFVRHEDDKANYCATYYSSNYIWFKVGRSYIALWKGSIQ